MYQLHDLFSLLIYRKTRRLNKLIHYPLTVLSPYHGFFTSLQSLHGYSDHVNWSKRVMSQPYSFFS